MLDRKNRILIFCDWFEPGYKAGGPIRSCVHFARTLKNDFDIFVVTSDRDYNETQAYSSIKTDTWIKFEEGIQIFYSSPEWLSGKNVFYLLKKINPDFVYLNSMYSKYFSLYPLLIKRFGLIKAKVILAPRGMLKQTALHFKKTKKKFFLTLFRLFGFHNIVSFHATDEEERKDIFFNFGSTVRIQKLANFSGTFLPYDGPAKKDRNELKMICVSRIHPIKNIDFLLTNLKSVKGAVHLTIVGVEEDKNYAAFCRDLIKSLPLNIIVEVKGERPHHKVVDMMHKYHIFVLPTRGENFGHAIFEALAAGKPVLISDQTPWKGLAKHKAGWDIPLNDKQEFVTIINKLVEMEQAEYNEWSYAAWNYSKKYTSDSDLKKGYLNLFQ